MDESQRYIGPAEALRELRAINARFIREFVTNDAEGHAELLHPRFVTIQADGSVLDREAYLRKWAAGFSPETIPYWDTRDERITVLGSVALVRSTNKYVIVRNGLETVGMAAYTDTYVLEGGRWLCVLAQITPVKPEFQPGDDTIVSVYRNGRLQ